MSLRLVGTASQPSGQIVAGRTAQHCALSSQCCVSTCLPKQSFAGVSRTQLGERVSDDRDAGPMCRAHHDRHTHPNAEAQDEFLQEGDHRGALLPRRADDGAGFALGRALQDAAALLHAACDTSVDSRVLVRTWSLQAFAAAAMWLVLGKALSGHQHSNSNSSTAGMSLHAPPGANKRINKQPSHTHHANSTRTHQRVESRGLHFKSVGSGGAHSCEQWQGSADQAIASFVPAVLPVRNANDAAWQGAGRGPLPRVLCLSVSQSLTAQEAGEVQPGSSSQAPDAPELTPNTTPSTAPDNTQHKNTSHPTSTPYGSPSDQRQQADANHGSMQWPPSSSQGEQLPSGQPQIAESGAGGPVPDLPQQYSAASSSSSATSKRSRPSRGGNSLLPAPPQPATYVSSPSGDSDTPGVPVLAPRTPRPVRVPSAPAGPPSRVQGGLQSSSIPGSGTPGLEGGEEEEEDSMLGIPSLAPPAPRTPRRRTAVGDAATLNSRPYPTSDSFLDAPPQLPASPGNLQLDGSSSDEEVMPQPRQLFGQPQDTLTSDQGAWEALWGGDGDAGYGTRIQDELQGYLQPPPSRIPRAQPLELFPLDQSRYPLLCPDTHTPLATLHGLGRVNDSPSQQSQQGSGASQQLHPHGSMQRQRHSSNSPQPPMQADSSGQQPSTSAPVQGAGVALPLVGPWVLTNHPRSFRACDAAVTYTAGPDYAQARLAVRLEYVAQREDDPEVAMQAAMRGEAQAQEQMAASLRGGAPIARLQLFNISRQRRGHQEEATVFVHSPASPSENRGSTQAAVRPGDRGLPLRPGDIITLGTARGAPRFLVAAPQGSASGPTAWQDVALQRYPGQLGQSMAQPQSLQQLAQLARVSPSAAEAGYRAAVSGTEKNNAFAWIAWAQMSVRQGALHKARALFRAAVAAAAPPSSGLAAQGSDRLASDSIAAAMGEDERDEQQRQSSISGGERASNLVPVHASPVMHGGVYDPLAADGAVVALVQALFTWARFEWNVARLRGTARHLWRAAADAAHLHSGGASAGGLGMIIHTWVLAELDQDNVYNARVVVAEGLRKCPTDQALFVMAANVELQGQNPELAREFCLRAYELDRTDKQLYLVWPRVMAALGERDKARVLFERGREYHPNNIKILAAYAAFEAEAGDVEMAMDLHDRALAIDSTSLTSMHNRVAWARLEADVGDLTAARDLLEEGLAAHPTHVPALLGMARVHRLSGQWAAAQAMLRTAQKLTHQFNTEVLRERALLLRALGEREMALALEAHLRTVSRVLDAKRNGVNTQEAWQLMLSDSRHPFRRQLSRAAFERKRQLGWLQAPGVPGAKGARRPAADATQGVAWVPLPGPQTPAYQGQAAPFPASSTQGEELGMARDRQPGSEAGAGMPHEGEPQARGDPEVTDAGAVAAAARSGLPGTAVGHSNGVNGYGGQSAGANGFSAPLPRGKGSLVQAEDDAANPVLPRTDASPGHEEGVEQTGALPRGRQGWQPEDDRGDEEDLSSPVLPDHSARHGPEEEEEEEEEPGHMRSPELVRQSRAMVGQRTLGHGPDGNAL